MRDKRGFTQTEIIGLILVVLVVGSVLIFIYKENILGWMRNLPGYSVPEKDEEIDISQQSDAIAKNLCPIIVGNIKNGKNIFFCSNLADSCGQEISSKLLWIGNSNNANIFVNQLVNDLIGNVAGGKLSINKDVLNKKGELYLEVKGDIPEYKFLINLNGAYFSMNRICRTELIPWEKDYTFGTKEDPFIGFDKNKEKINEKITNKEEFYFISNQGNKFRFHYSPDYTQPVAERKNVWMYDEIDRFLDFGKKNINIDYPIDSIKMPKDDEAINIIELILVNLREESKNAE